MPSGFYKYRAKCRRRYLKRMIAIKELDCYFYMVKLYDDKEAFIKIGITIDVPQRFSDVPYNCRVLIKEQMPIDRAYDFETSMLTNLYRDGVQYKPNKSFSGCTECFKTSSVILLQKKFDKKGFVRIKQEL